MLQTEKGLTLEQEAFAVAYARHGNGARAAREAYKSLVEADCNTASERGRILLRNPRVKARVDELTGRTEAVRQAVIVSEAERLVMLALDDGQPDLVRLIALRSAGARLLEVAGDGQARIVVRVEIVKATAAPMDGEGVLAGERVK